MKITFTKLGIMIIFMVLLLGVHHVCNKYGFKQVKHPSSPHATLKNRTAFPAVELSREMEQNIPRNLDVLSDAENIATTSHYTAPPPTRIIPQNSLGEGGFLTGTMMNEARQRLHDNQFENEHAMKDWLNHQAKQNIAVNRFAKSVKWPPLREVGVPEGDLEVRVWFIFEEVWMSLRLCRQAGRWTGYYASLCYTHATLIRENDALRLRYEQGRFPHNERPVLVVTPRTDWATLWEKIETLGILTLPDASTLADEKHHFGVDFVTYAVEINDGAHYRVYRYCNPTYQEWPEAEKLIQIIQTLRHEFISSLPTNEMPWY